MIAATVGGIAVVIVGRSDFAWVVLASAIV